MSNNVALLGRARFAEANGLGRHLITTLIEHPAILGPAKYLESNGWKVTYLPVDGDGCITAEQVKNATTSDTSIISVMWVNNEIGTIQPIDEIAKFAHAKEIFFHTDAVQAAGKIAIDLAATPINCLSLSGHKFHAPKGIGILFVRKLSNLMPIIFGGGQEMGLMPGTEGTANIVAIGAAAEVAHTEFHKTHKRLVEMQTLLIDKLTKIPGVRITGPADPKRRLPGHLSIIIEGAEGEAIVLRADIRGVSVSSGSACHQGIIEPSQVLKAIGLTNEQAMGSVRISAGALSTMDECETAAEILAKIFAGAAKKTGDGEASLLHKV
jgi:cysteine desulfurase